MKTDAEPELIAGRVRGELELTDESVFYNIGKRDAIAEVFALIRDVGINTALTRFADDLLKMEPDHPHARWYLETRGKSDRPENT